MPHHHHNHHHHRFLRCQIGGEHRALPTMTKTRIRRTQSTEYASRPKTTTTASDGVATTAMRVIVPLQGVVQGRGGLVLGSVIPCALFYFLQLYLKPNLSPPPTLPPLPGLHRVQSRSLISPKGAHTSSRANSIARQSDGPYYAGLKKVSEDGVIQLGLAENRLSLDLVREWLAENAKDSIIGGDLSIRGIPTYQPLDGLMELKSAVASFMSDVIGKSITFNPSQIILTADTTNAIEILSFCLADAGNAFLVPSPYYPKSSFDSIGIRQPTVQFAMESSWTSGASGESSDSIVELNRKTVDSQICSFQGDKNMPVLQFKDKIAGEIGLPAAKQRLIFRRKLLKDDHPLTEYRNLGLRFFH